jgi:hypothetical protein
VVAVVISSKGKRGNLELELFIMFFANDVNGWVGGKSE